MFESEYDIRDCLWRLEYLSENPVNLNTVDVAELFEIPYFTGSLAAHIVKYRRERGDFFSTREFFESVPSAISPEAAQILPYVSTGKEIAVPESEKRSKKKREFLRRLRVHAERDDATDAKVSPLRLRANLRGKTLKSDTYQLQIFRGTDETNIMDFASFFVSMRRENMGRFILGNYNARFGTGIALSSGGLRFPASATRFLRTREGMTFFPYGGTAEFFSLRGGAASVVLPFLSIHPFFSFRQLPTVYDTARRVTCLRLNNYSDNEQLIPSIRRIDERLLGTSITTPGNVPFSVSYLYYNQHFGETVAAASRILDDQNVHSLFARYSGEFYEIDAELANAGKKFALVGVVSFSAFSGTKTALSFYRFPKTYFVLHSESDESMEQAPVNEEGSRIRFSREMLTGTLYLDAALHRQMEPDNSEVRRSGSSAFVSWEGSLMKHWTARVAYRYRESVAVAGSAYPNSSIPGTGYRWKMENVFSVSRNIALRHRAEFSSYEFGTKREDGLLLSFSADCFFRNAEVSGVYYFFRSTGSRTAFRPVETALSGDFSTPYLGGDGSRAIIALQYGAETPTVFKAKVGRTVLLKKSPSQRKDETDMALSVEVWF